MYQQIKSSQPKKDVDVFYMEQVKVIREVITIGEEVIDKLINVYQVSKQMTDEEMILKEGHKFDASHYKITLKEDADVYDEEGQLILKLRKQVIPHHMCDQAVESFRQWATKFSTNRGAAAGLLNKKSLRPTYAKLIEDTNTEDKYYDKRFRCCIKKTNEKTGKTSNQSVSNLAPSNIVGYFDNYARNVDRSKKKIPCRITAYTAQRVEKWKKSLPFFDRCDAIFKSLVPKRHATQLAMCRKTPDYQINDTAFSTATINSSWRTACHKDAGDLDEGFGNLVVCEDKKNPRTYQGCFTGFPQYKICADVRQGDFIAMDVHRWHCNTEFVGTSIKEEIKKFKTKKAKINDVNGFDYNRLSVVMYYRKKMFKCQNK
jgi:hypothetical protein